MVKPNNPKFKFLRKIFWSLVLFNKETTELFSFSLAYIILTVHVVVVVVVVVIQFFIRCCPFRRDGWIYPILSAIACTPSLHLSRLRASSFFKPIFSVSSSTCFFQVFFGRPHFLLPFTSRFRATLKTLLSSLLCTCSHYLSNSIHCC